MNNKKKKRAKPRKAARTESQVREMIAKHERLLQNWISKMTIANNKIKAHSKKLHYYNLRLAKMSEKREQKSIRSINLSELE